MFDRRLGFSGTPSDLLPVELGRCAYEKGADGKMLQVLTNPQVMAVDHVPMDWSVESLLRRVARGAGAGGSSSEGVEKNGGSSSSGSGGGGYRALIDTGALITGMTNLQVAQFLLAAGLEGLEGVVFLNEADKKMILLRNGHAVLPLEQCGIDKAKRFSFYDQVHTTVRKSSREVSLNSQMCAALVGFFLFLFLAETSFHFRRSCHLCNYLYSHLVLRDLRVNACLSISICKYQGMDIKQALDAKAALTLGKDMTFRDYAQGAFRMRGIGSGQKVDLLVVPEVLELVHTHVGAGLGISGGAQGHRSTVHEKLGALGTPKRDAQVLKDVTAWLVLNQMRSEKTQFNLLCEQNVANVWRKRAFGSLVHSRAVIGRTAATVRTLAIEQGGTGGNAEKVSMAGSSLSLFDFCPSLDLWMLCMWTVIVRCARFDFCLRYRSSVVFLLC